MASRAATKYCVGLAQAARRSNHSGRPLSACAASRLACVSRSRRPWLHPSPRAAVPPERYRPLGLAIARGPCASSAECLARAASCLAFLKRSVVLGTLGSPLPKRLDGPCGEPTSARLPPCERCNLPAAPRPARRYRAKRFARVGSVSRTAGGVLSARERFVVGVCTENLIRVDAVMESPKLAE